MAKRQPREIDITGLPKTNRLQHLIELIVGDELLSGPMKKFLIAYYSDDCFLNHNKAIALAGLKIDTWYKWKQYKGDVKREHFQKWMDIVDTELMDVAIAGVYKEMKNGNFLAQKFILETLHKKYKKKLDITSDNQPITAIKIQMIQDERTDDQSTS